MYFSRRYFFKAGIQFILTKMLECLNYTHLGFLLGIALGVCMGGGGAVNKVCVFMQIQISTWNIKLLSQKNDLASKI